MGNFTHRQRSLFLWWISVLLLALSNNASGESPPSSSDPFFVYSQSFSFEYDHAEEQQHQQHQQQHRKHHLHNYEQPQHDNFDIVYSQNTAPSSTDSTTSSSTTSTSSSSSTWVSRVEQEFQTDAYSFESPFDVSMFSPEEMEKIEKQYEEQSDDDDEDDDDDNDGSCSMLSNASISRVQVVTHQEPHPATTPATAKIRGGAQTMIRTSGVPTITQTSQTFSTIPRHARHAKTSSRTILSLRGGATTTTVVESVGSEVLKRLFVSALVTLLFEASMGHIFEFIKIAMQTSPTKTTYGAVIRDITAEKGWGGLWDGFVPWGVVQAVSKGAVFGMAHSMATHLLMPLSDTGVLPTMLVLTLAGGIGGGVQGYVLSPLLLLKTRVMTNPVFRKKLSIWKTSVLSASVGFDLVRTEGLSSLMKGANIFATKRVFDWATRFYFAEMIEALVYYLKGNQPLTLWEKSVSSFLGGVLSTILTLPLDVLVAKAQDAKKAGVKVSAFKLFNDELQEKGWKGLASDYLNGFSVRLIHVCLTVVMMKTFTNVVYEVLFG